MPKPVTLLDLIHFDTACNLAKDYADEAADFLQQAHDEAEATRLYREHTGTEARPDAALVVVPLPD